MLFFFFSLRSAVPIYEARTTSDAAGRSDTRGTLLPACPAASHCNMPCGFFFFLANSCRSGSDLGRFALNRVDSSRIGQNNLFRPKFKKKKVRNTPFEPNIKPYFQLTSYKHTKQALCLSLTPSLVSHSLCALYLLLIVLLIIFYFVLVSNL